MNSQLLHGPDFSNQKRNVIGYFGRLRKRALLRKREFALGLANLATTVCGTLLLLIFSSDKVSAKQDPFHSPSSVSPDIKLQGEKSLTGRLSSQYLKLVPLSDLPAGARMKLGSTSLTHPTRIKSIRFSPDDQILATADSNGIVRVWETFSGKLLLEKANGGGRQIAFSPDGKTIALGGYYNPQIILWDLTTNEYFGSITQNARSLVYSADGKILFAAGQDRIVRAWNIETRKLVKEFKGHEAELFALALSPDGSTIASAGGNGGNSKHNEIRLWDTKSGELLAVLDDDFDYYEKLPDAIYSLAFSSDGKTLGSSGPYVVRLWDVERQKVVERLRDAHYDIEFAPDKDQFVTPGDLAIFDLKSRKPVLKLNGDVGVYGVVEYSHDGKWIATGNDKGRVQLWNTRTGQELKIRHGHEAGVRGLSISTNGDMVASVSREDQSIRVWGLESGKEIKKIPATWKGSDVWWNEEGSNVMFAPYGNQILTWQYDGVIRSWSLERNHEHQVRLAAKGIVLLTFSNDGNLVAAVEYDGGSNKLVSIYEFDGGKLIATIDPFADQKKSYDSWISSLAFSTDGRRLAIGALSDTIQDQPANSIQIWDLEKVERVGQMRNAVAPPGNLEFSPDDKWLAASSSRGAKLEIRQVDDSRVVKELDVTADAHGRDPAPMRFSADGKLFAAADAKRRIFVWETLTWKQLKTFEGHDKAITDVEFSPDGKSLISSSEDATLLVWEVSPSANTLVSKLSDRQLKGYWDALTSNDSSVADLAMRALIHAPEQTVELFATQLNVGFVLRPENIPKLIDQLKQEDPEIHLKAFVQLREFGSMASAPLFRELTSTKNDAGVKSRVEELLATINQFPVSKSELRRLRAIQILERLGDESAQKILRKLAESEIRSTACKEAEAALIRLKKRAQVRS